MKGFFKLYSVISVTFVFFIFTLVAIFPSHFLNFIDEVQKLVFSDTQTISDIFSIGLPFIQTMFAYLFTAYALNIIANIVIAVLAYISENKFNAAVTRYALIVNVIFFFVIVYFAKLIVEGGYKTIRRIFTRRA